MTYQPKHRIRKFQNARMGERTKKIVHQPVTVGNDKGKQHDTRTTATTISSSSSPIPSTTSPLFFNLIIVGVVLPFMMTTLAVYIGNKALATSTKTSLNSSPPAFVIRLVLSILLNSVYGVACYTIIIPPVRIVARTYLPGACVPSSRHDCEDQENASNDPSLIWPLPSTLKQIPNEWIGFVESNNSNHTTTTTRTDENASSCSKAKQPPTKKDRPFFLNHVRGSTRFRQAMFRISSAFGTVAMLFVMTNYVDDYNYYDTNNNTNDTNTNGTSTFYDGYLSISFVDIGYGILVGSCVVACLFGMELYLGWIHIIGYNEVIVKEEYLVLNLVWDVLFHIGVSISEEIPLRGWILLHTTKAIFETTNHSNGNSSTSTMMMQRVPVSPSYAMLIAGVLQAILFAIIHWNSPGVTKYGLYNLLLGGLCGGVNVYITGGISFSLGWHFGWNICMGHLLGLSTSGIPMSAKLISIVPHPLKSQYHGAQFGPEQSPIASVAYLLGCVLLLLIYGTERIHLWNERFVVSSSSIG